MTADSHLEKFPMSSDDIRTLNFKVLTENSKKIYRLLQGTHRIPRCHPAMTQSQAHNLRDFCTEASKSTINLAQNVIISDETSHKLRFASKLGPNESDIRGTNFGET
jgi:hypothetical protein